MKLKDFLDEFVPDYEDINILDYETGEHFASGDKLDVKYFNEWRVEYIEANLDELDIFVSTPSGMTYTKVHSIPNGGSVWKVERSLDGFMDWLKSSDSPEQSAFIFELTRLYDWYKKGK